MADKRIETASMLIKFFNIQAATSFRTGNPTNQQVVLDALDRANGDIIAVKNHIRKYVGNGEKDIIACFESFKAVVDVQAVEVPAQPATSEASVAGAMDILSATITSILAQTQIPQIEAAIMGGVEQKVRDFIQSEYGAIERKVITVIDGKKVPMEGVQHEKFDTVVKFVANDVPVFLTGAAGTGKNVLCKQVAKALGLNFYFTNAVTQEYQLKGFTDAMGNYQPTQFYKAFTEGGVFMLDEMDASIPEVLVILNAAIANRYFDFPAPIGYVEAHPDFRVIAAGNTYGTGASYEYVGRNQLDAASLNRFAVVRVDYSETIENSVAGGDIKLADFCRAFRKAARDAGQQVVVSYRNIGMIAKMSQIMELDEVIETCLVKGMEKDDLNIIINSMSDVDPKYRRALRSIANRL